MSERAGRCFEHGEVEAVGMLSERSFHFVVSVIDVFEGINAEICEDVVKETSAVSLAQDHAVPVICAVVLRVVSQKVIVESDSDIAQ